MIEITSEIVRELLDYDPDTGVFTWRVRDEKWFKSGGLCRSWNARFAGTRAGSVLTDPRQGYQCRQIKILRKLMKEHRLAWVFVTGGPIPEQIDHLDRDGTNNRWENLRASTSTENSRNRSLRVDSSSGATGVSWRADTKKWRARCMAGGVYQYLGSYDIFSDADAVVRAFREKAGFSPEHGASVAHYHM